MEKETMGTVISVTKQWWLKVNRCSLVRDFVSCANPFSADVIFSVYRIFDLDSMRKGCAIHSMSADRFTIKVTYCEDKPSKARIEL